MNEGLRTSETRDSDGSPPASPNAGESGSMLEQRARQSGTVVGKAVVVARQAQGKLKDVRGDVEKSLSELADTAKAKANELAEEVTARASDVQCMAKEKTTELLDVIGAGMHLRRDRVDRVDMRHPVEMELADAV